MSWESSIDEQIRAAMARGDFDNLPGKGEPMRLEKFGGDDPDWLVNHVLTENGFAPPLLETSKQIRADLAAARRRLGNVWRWCQHDRDWGAAPAPLREKWQRATVTFRDEMAELNRQIRTHNLKAPAALHLPIINPEQEISRIANG